MTQKRRSRRRTTDDGDDRAGPGDSGADDPVGETSAEETEGTDPGPNRDTGATREPTDGDEGDHLNDLEDGAGCTEIWEHLSERRDG